MANALNQLSAANLSTAASVHRLAELIDEEFMQSESESSSDEEEEVLPALADRYNESDIDIAHPDNVHDVDDMPPLALHV